MSKKSILLISLFTILLTGISFKYVYAQCPSLNSEEIRLAQTYDKNQNGVIDDSERDAIISDWKGGRISDGQFLNLMRYWRYQCKIPRIEVTVVFPNGGEQLEIGKGYRIQWKCNAPKELLYEISTVKISLLKGGSFYKAIGWADTICLPDRVNTYSWTVKDVEAGKDYQILIELFAPGAPETEVPRVLAKDVSDGYFEIIPTPPPTLSITVLSPNGGEKWEIGKGYWIRWNATGVNAVDITLISPVSSKVIATKVPAKTGGGIFFPQTEGIFSQATGEYFWIISRDIEPRDDYKIVISATEAPSIKDESDNYFSIVAPPKEDPVEGSLSVDKTQAKVGENITLTITAQDDQGVYSVMAYYQGSWHTQYCNNQTSCTKTWTFSESTPGIKTYYGYVYGRKLNGSIEGSYTKPSYVRVEIISQTPTNLPDLVVEDIFYENPYIKVKYCNRGEGTSNADFLIKLKNENTGQEYGGNPYYRFSVPQPGQCAVTGGYTPGLIGLSYGKQARVTAIIDWEQRVQESNETNNSLTKTIGGTGTITSSLEDLSSLVASLQEMVRRLMETLEKLGR